MTDFEKLARSAYEVRGKWHGFMARGGWHVSIFPEGKKGKRTFREFHVTKEKVVGNKHHFYTDDGHVDLNNIDNVEFGDRPAWTTANRLASDFYRTMLGLHVTPEMLGEEVTNLRRRSGAVVTTEVHEATVRARREQHAKQQEVPRTAPVDDIDMFAADDMFAPDEVVPTSASAHGLGQLPPPAAYGGAATTSPFAAYGPATTSPPVPPMTPAPAPTTTSSPGPATTPVPAPTPARASAPVVALPPIVDPVPQTAHDLHGLYTRQLSALELDESTRHRWSEALDRLCAHFVRFEVTDADHMRRLYEQVFTSRLSL